MTSFSGDDEEKLINIVAGHPVLYETSNPNYRNNLIKDKVWRAIGKELNKNSIECKRKWKFIRDGYHRFKKKHKLGEVVPKQSKDKRHLLLLFLDSLPQHTSGGSNLPSSPTVLQSYENGENDPLSSNEQEVSKDGATSYTEKDSDDEHISEIEVANEQKTNLAMNENRNKGDYIAKVWKDRKEKRPSLMKSISKKRDDDIDFFVKHIGEVLRNLPQVEKAQAKKHLYAVLSDYEIMAAKIFTKRRRSSSLSNYISDVSTSFSD